MPIRVYGCAHCDNVTEERIEFNEPGPYEYPFCPACGNRMIRQVTAANPQFKGDGWTVRGPRHER